jgi:hypothetical protein
MGRVEAIINSMTLKERRNHEIINGSRRRRIAGGSGCSVQEVNQLLKQYREARKMMRAMTGGIKKGGLKRKKMGKGGRGGAARRWPTIRRACRAGSGAKDRRSAARIQVDSICEVWNWEGERNYGGHSADAHRRQEETDVSRHRDR